MWVDHVYDATERRTSDSRSHRMWADTGALSTMQPHRMPSNYISPVSEVPQRGFCVPPGTVVERHEQAVSSWASNKQTIGSSSCAMLSPTKRFCESGNRSNVRPCLTGPPRRIESIEPVDCFERKTHSRILIPHILDRREKMRTRKNMVKKKQKTTYEAWLHKQPDRELCH